MKETLLKQYMNSVPSGEYASVKDEIIKECRITTEVWKNWLSGRTRIPKLAKPIINSIAEQEIYKELDITNQY